MVLDGIGRASIEQLGDGCPFVSKSVVGLDDDAILLGRPVGFPDLGAQVVEPSLSALLSNTSLKVRVNEMQHGDVFCI